jgi:uncharacterized membrane protein YraQ (UPF0718 family)
MNWRDEWKALLVLAAVFFAAWYVPVGEPRFDGAVKESLALTKWYAREHVVLCLLPAFFIAGAISVFVSQAAVMKYLGARANKVLAYGVAAVSGTILAVCSCTVLPLFAGIWKRGAGLGPATAFLYSGPAINVLAIILTARILGFEIGVARAVGAVVFSVLIGLLMHLVYRKEERARAEAAAADPEPEVHRPLWKTAAYFASMVAVLVFANWAVQKPGDPDSFYYAVGSVKWILTTASAAAFAVMLVAWFGLAWWKVVAAAAAVAALALVLPEEPMIAFAAGVVGLAVITSTDTGEVGEWFAATWGFTKQITPLLLAGVLVSGFLLGGPGKGGVVPAEWISGAVGGNSLGANFFASLAGALMYFATLTEVPILQGLIGSGMGKGPALALLLAGPALSLPSMIVLASVMGTKKMLVYVSLVVVMATITGMGYGMLF